MDIVVVGRVLAVHEQDVVEAAGDDQAGERPQPGEPALALVLVQAGMAEAGRRVPADRGTAIVAIGNVQRPVDEHGEPQARAGSELEHPHAALDAVAQRHQPDARELRQHAGMLRQLPSRAPVPVERHHG